MRFILSAFSCLNIILLASCGDNTVYEESLKIEAAEWHRNNRAQYVFDIDDSSAIYSFSINFRHGGSYPYKNIYLFCRTESPSGKIAIDTAQMILTDQYNRWMGKGIGDLFDYQFMFKKGNLFPENGTYNVSIEQGMRDLILPEITDIGIAIKREPLP